MRFSGVGGHHQNGKVRRTIRTMMAIAQTMLLHLVIHCHDMIDSILWTMAVKDVNLPNADAGLSPFDLWTKTWFCLYKLHSLHVFGCPVYVLKKKLADRKKIGIW